MGRYELIKQVFSIVGERPIVKLMEEFELEMQTILKKQPFDLIIDEFQKSTNNINLNDYKTEPSILLQIILLINSIWVALYDEIENNYRIDVLKIALKNSISNQLDDLIIQTDHQLFELFNQIETITNECLDKYPNSRFYILELPVGNSIPSFFLKKYFELKGKSAELVTISINRNDTVKEGITRKQLLENKLGKIPNSNSILIYIDEWISGASFYNVSKLISKFYNFLFIPCAFLLDQSLKKDKYAERKKNYDKICEVIDIKLEKLIKIIPDLNNKIVSHQKFVWAESDRLAGFRKLEFVGSIASTIMETGELFYNDRELSNKYIEKFLNTEKFDKQLKLEIHNKIFKSIEYFHSVFKNNLKNRFSQIDVSLNKLQDINNYENKILNTLKSIHGYDEAYYAICLIILYIKNFKINPDNRYYFSGKAPSCVKLDYPDSFLNEIFKKKLNEKYLQNT